MRKIFLLLLVICFTILSYSQSLYEKMDSLRREYHVPEMGVAVISSQKIMEIAVCGYHKITDQTKKDTAKLTDRFHLGSNTKAITGFIAATLVEQGKIKWDTKFFDLYPELKKEANPGYYNITLQQLLSHRAGIQPFTSGEKEKAPHSKGSKQEQRVAFAKYVLKMTVVERKDKKPFDYAGSDYVYSNAGYTLAAMMLEKASGKSWEVLAQQLMTNRLVLRIGFGWPNAVDTNQPWGHWTMAANLVPVSPKTTYSLALLEPAGDINITLPDYSKFIQLQLIGLGGKDSIIKSSTYHFLHYGLKAYSIGWMNGLTKTHKVYSAHEGSAGTYHVLTAIFPEDDRAFIICLNVSNENADKAKGALLKFMMDNYGK